MQFSPESIIQFTKADGWTAHITDKLDGETWTVPVIGWAVVVGGVDYDGRRAPNTVFETGGDMHTVLQAVVLAGEHVPETLPAYLASLTTSRSWLSQYAVALKRTDTEVSRSPVSQRL
jgi:hypothetical protein